MTKKKKHKAIASPSRRRFVGGAGALGAISTMEWLGFFRENGVPGSAKDWGIAKARANEEGGQRGGTAPTYLIYYFVEGGWMSYSMFSPVQTPNHSALNIAPGTLYPTPAWGDQIYRTTAFENDNNFVRMAPNGTQYGYLGDDGADLIPEMAVVSSHYGDTFHSRARLEYHYGTGYSLPMQGRRQDDERSVLQAFCENKGASFLLPHVSWHRYLSDGELDFNNYPVGTGYYEQLGPVHAHTVYGKTPSDMRSRLSAIGDVNVASRRTVIRQYTDRLHDNFVQSRDGQSVRSFSSALEIYRSLSQGELSVDVNALFRDQDLRDEFGIQAGDEDLEFRSINGNPARSKECPHTRVQAMMTYELMRANVSNGFWIETQPVRGFDSHRGRRNVTQNDTMPDQKNTMNEHVWQPLRALVNRLKNTEVPGIPGLCMWDQTTIVLCSEMGRTMFGDVGDILNGGGDRYDEIMKQDICQHWDVSSAAFMGGNVNPGQYGGVGTQTLDAIPLMPDGSKDPAYDPVTGVQSGTKTGDVSDAGSIFATALKMAGVDPNGPGTGRNNRPALDFVIKNA